LISSSSAKFSPVGLNCFGSKTTLAIKADR